MTGEFKLFTFVLNGRRYGLPLSCVVRVLPSVEVAPLPKASDIVMGVIDVQGKILPVLDMRKRFHLHEKEISLNDKFVIAQAGGRTVALLAEDVAGIADVGEQDMTETEAIFPGVDYVKGVARLKDGMVLLLEMDRIISNEQLSKIGYQGGENA